MTALKLSALTNSLQDWLPKANRLMDRYRNKADQHWQCIGQFPAHDRFGIRQFQFFKEADPKSAKPCTEWDTPDPEQAIQQTKDLYNLIAQAQKIDLSIPTRYNERNDRETVVLAMYVNLSLWLCACFHGSPRADIWEDTVALSRKLGAFPGDAFFNKLVGDLYRSERFKRLRPDRATPPYKLKNKQSDMDGIMTMSFNPIILIDDFDCLHFSRDIQIDSLDKEINPLLRAFAREVAMLSSRYMRFQIWRYLFDSDFAIYYGVAHWSLMETLDDLAADIVWQQHEPTTFLTEREQLPLTNPSKSRREVLRAKRQQHKQGTFANQHKAKLDELKRKGEQQANKFFARFAAGGANGHYEPCYTARSKRRLVVFSEVQTRREALTSSVWSRADGVRADPPTRIGGWEQCCEWKEGLPVVAAREKLRSVWTDVLTFSNQDQWAEPGSDFTGFLSDCERLPKIEIPSSSNGATRE